MKAVGVIEYGGPEALQVVDVPEVHAGPGEVRIRVHAATVNPTDTYGRDGSRAETQKKDPPPYVPGMDAAGVLDEIGEGTETNLAIGDAVMCMVLPNGSHGGYRQSLVMPASAVTRAPIGATHIEASTLPMNALTARLTLDMLGLSAGQTLAVTGAAGCYGGYVVQLAKADGLTVIADAKDSDRDLVASLGADIVVERGDDVADRILAACPGGVDGLADGSVQNEQVVPAIADGGGYASVRGWTGQEERGISFHTVWVNKYENDFERLDRIRQQADDGLITLRVAQVHRMQDASVAHANLEAGGTRGRQVIDLS